MNEEQIALRLMAETILQAGGANRYALPELIEEQVKLYLAMARGEQPVFMGSTVEFPKRVVDERVAK